MLVFSYSQRKCTFDELGWRNFGKRGPRLRALLIGAPAIGFSPRNELTGKVRLSSSFSFLNKNKTSFQLFYFSLCLVTEKSKEKERKNEDFKNLFHVWQLSRTVQLGSDDVKKKYDFFIYVSLFLAFSSLPDGACPSVWSLRKLKKIKKRKEKKNKIRNSSCFIFI